MINSNYKQIQSCDEILNYVLRYEPYGTAYKNIKIFQTRPIQTLLQLPGKNMVSKPSL